MRIFFYRTKGGSSEGEIYFLIFKWVLLGDPIFMCLLATNRMCLVGRCMRHASTKRVVASDHKNNYCP